MKVLEVRNVAEALPAGVHWLLAAGVREETRNGPVLVSPVPVTTVYERPTERVLFSSIRDANPFFHIVEALWMLAGRDDAALLNRFVKDFGERYAEPDGNVHGAYGIRWRSHFPHPDRAGEFGDSLPFDQLDWAVERLRADPTSRQVVIEMWDPDADATSHPVKDRPCNTHIYLRVREEAIIRAGDRAPDQVLDLTVCCRSNDNIWGAHGANAVHFSVLQEYLAARIGVQVGRLYQVSNNFHMYVSEMKRMEERVIKDRGTMGGFALSAFLKDVRPLASQRLVDDPKSFDREVQQLLTLYEGLEDTGEDAAHIQVETFLNRFLPETVWPMLIAHLRWKSRGAGPFAGASIQTWLQNIKAHDWNVAATEWIARRS